MKGAPWAGACIPCGWGKYEQRIEYYDRCRMPLLDWLGSGATATGKLPDSGSVEGLPNKDYCRYAAFGIRLTCRFQRHLGKPIGVGKTEGDRQSRIAH